MSSETRNKLKAKFKSQIARLPSSWSEHHYDQRVRSLVTAYRIKIYEHKFGYKPKQIAECLGVQPNRVYELARKLG